MVKYEPSLDSLRTHPVPQWFEDAKLGIFIHWGLYSVPGYAVTKTEIQQGMRGHRYAEWYLDSLRKRQPATWKYHLDHYGSDFDYYQFKETFNDQVKQWDPNAMAEIIRTAGARYVVLVTKHHDGFCLWPTKHPNPKNPQLAAQRDIVGDLAKATRAKGMRFGTYYSSLLDWAYHPHPNAAHGIKKLIRSLTYSAWNFYRYPKHEDLMAILAGKAEPEYTQYAESHWRELIENYKPDILWSDIGYPPTRRLEHLIADYYNLIPEGIVDDRWRQREITEIYCQNRKFRGPIGFFRRLYHFAQSKKRSPPFHYDFTTPEYHTYNSIQEKKWEATRGIGYSFGINLREGEMEYLSVKELIHLFIDIVSKNGNLLLNIGPQSDGSIHPIQLDRLKHLGEWLQIHEEGIYGSRPWIKAEGISTTQQKIRFTRKGDSLYIFILDTPKMPTITITDFPVSEITVGTVLGTKGSISLKSENNTLTVSFAENILKDLSEFPAFCVKIPLIQKG